MRNAILDDLTMIEVPSKAIEFEDGTKQRVGAFRISKNSVSVPQFQSFIEATKYVCDARRQQSSKTYFDNELINDLAMPERNRQPAFCVSYNDAVEFGRWAGVDLPCEAEWMAASVVVWNDSDVDFDELLETDFESRPDTILTGGYDWTSTSDSKGNHVLRGGPLYYLHEDWRDGDDRHISKLDNVDLFNSFKVVLRE